MSDAWRLHSGTCIVQPGDTAGVLALRAMPLLLAAAAAAVSFPAYAWQAAVVGLCAVSPLPDAVSLPLLSVSSLLRIDHRFVVNLAVTLQVCIYGATAGSS